MVHGAVLLVRLIVASLCVAPGSLCNAIADSGGDSPKKVGKRDHREKEQAKFGKGQAKGPQKPGQRDRTKKAKGVTGTGHEVKLKNGKRSTDITAVTLKGGEPFEFTLSYRTTDDSAGKIPVHGMIYYKHPKYGEVIADTFGAVPEKVEGGEFRIQGKLRVHRMNFRNGTQYRLRIENRNGVFYETPIKMVR